MGTIESVVKKFPEVAISQVSRVSTVRYITFRSLHSDIFSDQSSFQQVADFMRERERADNPANLTEQVGRMGPRGRLVAALPPAVYFPTRRALLEQAIEKDHQLLAYYEEGLGTDPEEVEELSFRMFSHETELALIDRVWPGS